MPYQTSVNYMYAVLLTIIPFPFDMAFCIHLPEFISFPEEYINGHNETYDTVKN